jgi:renalase
LNQASLSQDVIVIGAGVAGLECARRLSAAGRSVRVLDRAKGVGGRCATKRFDGQPVDFGPVFLHGSTPEFVAAVADVSGATLLRAWPQHIDGRGAPCQPSAFNASEQRFAFAEGVSAFPKHLARGLDVRLSTNVLRLGETEDAFAVHTASGEVHEARDVVIALALEQSVALLASLADTSLGARELQGTRALLGMFKSVPSLALIAGYGTEAPLPPWDVWYPEDSDCLQLVSHESAKVSSPRARVLVFQARPRWARTHLGSPPEQWAPQLLAAGAPRLGAFVLTPQFQHPHAWRYARLERDNELSQPLCIPLSRNRRLGVAGDLFAPGGGVQAAWLSGKLLAERLLSSS